ncbi:V-type proton ATPase subunit C [Melipona quadrifasciata]|uniref:V-type proton ATPase subunit C n=1 Tax=Melipona quadrifasciata TaxID=166423 RepID=A0A0N0BI63_9HYME|nr:V-type proton ATPase subunit C [Melipona quadrifasciata]
MTEYWLISAPGDKTCQQTWETMNNLTSKQHSLSVNYKFHIPDLKVGTLDQLVGLSDDLGKLDAYVEQVTRKVATYLGEVLEDQRDKLHENLLANNSIDRFFVYDVCQTSVDGESSSPEGGPDTPPNTPVTPSHKSSKEHHKQWKESEKCDPEPAACICDVKSSSDPLSAYSCYHAHWCAASTSSTPIPSPTPTSPSLSLSSNCSSEGEIRWQSATRHRTTEKADQSTSNCKSLGNDDDEDDADQNNDQDQDQDHSGNLPNPGTRPITARSTRRPFPVHLVIRPFERKRERLSFHSIIKSIEKMIFACSFCLEEKETKIIKTHVSIFLRHYILKACCGRMNEYVVYYLDHYQPYFSYILTASFYNFLISYSFISYFFSNLLHKFFFIHITKNILLINFYKMPHKQHEILKCLSLAVYCVYVITVHATPFRFLIYTSDLPSYITRFQWDMAKYPIKQSLRNIADIISKQVGQIDADLKTKSTTYNNLKGSLQNLEKKQTGSLLTRNLADLVKKEHFILDSEYLTTLLVIVPRAYFQEWYSGYEKLIKMVVPRTTQLIAQDSEYGLFTVTLFKKAIDEFKLHAREKKFIVRDFTYNEEELAAGKNEITKLVTDKKKQFGPLVRWLKVNFSECFCAWIHVKALRVFVESVLRYGLPVNFQAILLHPHKRCARRLRDVLNQHYAHLDSSATASSATQANQDNVDIPGLGFGQNDYFPYVYYKINVDMVDSKV